MILSCPYQSYRNRCSTWSEEYFLFFFSTTFKGHNKGGWRNIKGFDCHLRSKGDAVTLMITMNGCWRWSMACRILKWIRMGVVPLEEKAEDSQVDTAGHQCTRAVRGSRSYQTQRILHIQCRYVNSWLTISSDIRHRKLKINWPTTLSRGPGHHMSIHITIININI